MKQSHYQSIRLWRIIYIQLVLLTNTPLDDKDIKTDDSCSVRNEKEMESTKLAMEKVAEPVPMKRVPGDTYNISIT